jgi:microcompartment protein CcmL/EutN
MLQAKKTEPDTIGLLELSSIATGYEVEDAMLKAANVELLLARTICSGKYLVVVAGDTSGVTASVEAGEELAGNALIEARVIPRVSSQIFPAISGVVNLGEEDIGALGVVETFSASSIIDAADAAAKAADVTLFRIHLAMAIGGKGFFLVTGTVSAVEAAVAAGEDVARDSGILVDRRVIPRPREALFREYI